MELEEAREKFINAWGTLGTNWGINRTMAQIHALLLVSPQPQDTEEIMKKLQISRGNASMNIRALIDWGLIDRVHKSGERKEFYQAEKDIWEAARKIARERRKREIEPVINLLKDIQNVEGKDSRELSEFKAVTGDVLKFSKQADSALDKFIRSDEHWFYGTLVKLMK